MTAEASAARPHPLPRSHPSSPWVVRSERLSAIEEGEAILTAARAQAESLREAATRDAASLHRQAQDAGLAEGAREAAALVGAAQAAIAVQREADAAEMLPLAFAIAHRILGAFDEDDRLHRAARAALDEHHNLAGLRLRVAPAAADVLRAALRAEGLTTVAVDADDGVGRDGCTLVHPRGRAAVGPIDQLREIMASQRIDGA